MHRGKPDLGPAHTVAEDYYFAERTEDDITGSDLVGQSAERGVSWPPTRGKLIFKSFIRFLPMNQKSSQNLVLVF